MSKKSRDKGKRGEREVRDLWRVIRPDSRRSGHEQVQGDACASDVDVGEGYAVEVKLYKRLSWTIVRRALEQAGEVAREREGNDVPVAFVRSDRDKWVAVLDAAHFLSMVSKLDDRDS